MNSLTACVIHAVLTFTVTGRHGFKLPVQQQYIVYGAYALALGVGFYFWNALRKSVAWISESRKNRRVSETGDKGKEDGSGEEDKEMNLYPAMPYSIPREH